MHIALYRMPRCLALSSSAAKKMGMAELQHRDGVFAN